MPRLDKAEDLSVEIMRKRIKHQTIAHLRDIARAHGSGKRWTSLPIPTGTPYFVSTPLPLSAAGSPAALCAAEGDSCIPVSAAF